MLSLRTLPLALCLSLAGCTDEPVVPAPNASDAGATTTGGVAGAVGSPVGETSSVGSGGSAGAPGDSSASGGTSSSGGTGAAAGVGGDSSDASGSTSDGAESSTGGTQNPPNPPLLRVPGAALYDCEPKSEQTYRLGVEVVTTEVVRPMLVTHAPDDASRLFVIEENGRIVIIKDGELLAKPFLDITAKVSRTSSDIGLLGLAFHPNYESNQRFFVHYNAEQGVHGLQNGDTVVAEYLASESDPDLADEASERVILTHLQPAEHHNGGSIQFSADGMFYLGLGDGSNGGDAFQHGQDTSTILAAILRLDVDQQTQQAYGNYGIPEGNMQGDGVAPELWDYGLRNPYRFSFDGCTSDLYIGDVGQDDLEEVNVERAGQGHNNFGWSIREGTACYREQNCDDNLTMPVIEYSHGKGLAVIGGYVYRGSSIPGLRGTYIYADHSSQTVFSFELEGDRAVNQRVLSDEFDLGSGNIYSFGQDALGEVYITRADGTIHKIVALSD